MRTFWQDTLGAYIVQSIIGSILLFAAAGFAIDFGRLYNLQTVMQAYADYVALAAAAELDKSSTAITRARAAAKGPLPDGSIVSPLQKFQFFGYGGEELTIEEPVFLSAIPNDPISQKDISDLQPYVTTNPSQARYVLIIVQPRTIGFSLLLFLRSAVASAATSASTNAIAVATFKREVCNFPPMMICNPSETVVNKTFTANEGEQILLKAKGNGASWVPGDFGLLDTVATAGAGTCTGGLGGTNRIRCVLGLVNSNNVCVEGTVNVRPGEAVSVHTGLNLRFDIWDPPLQNQKANSAFAPSANVIKGSNPQNTGGQCTLNAQQAASSTAMPRDPCFSTATCGGGNRFGDGVTTAQLSAYWLQNHSAALPAELVGGTRYEAYRYEVDNGLLNNLGPAAPRENGAPVCATSTPVNNPIRDRRVLITAVVNCLENNVRGSKDNVPVVAFVRMFMTEPVTATDDIYAEVLGIAESGSDDGVLHDYPVLVR